MKPYPGYVFVNPDSKASETISGLILVTEKVTPHNAMGVVTDIGNGVIDVAIGDHVVYSLAESTNFRDGEATLTAVPVKAIFAVAEA